MDLSPSTFSCPRRRGVTLVELLVIISIMVVLTAVAVPAMRPALEGRRVREAARAINMYLDSARNRAIETGRPCGVSIQRFAALPQCAMELDQVEVPPPYAGDTDPTLAQVQILSSSSVDPNDPKNSLILYTLQAQLTTDPASSLNAALVNPGDSVQFNYQGPLYTIVNATSNALSFTITLSQDQFLHWPNANANPAWSLPMPFRIYRQPVKSHAAPLQLPARAVIDVESSGCDDAFTVESATNTKISSFWQGQLQSPPTQPVMIMFSPNGSVEGFYYELGTPNNKDRQPYKATQPIFLLVGKRERVPAGLAQDGKSNWQDLTNLWVTLNPQTGLISTTEVAVGNDLFTARAFARQGQSMGGR